MTEEPRAIRAALCRLDGDAFAAFVADLWRERGWDAERDGTTIRVSRTGERRTLFARPATRRARWFGSVPAAADTVVSAAASESEGVVDAREFVSMLRYAVPPAAADRLCERHLGAPPSELAPPASVRVRRAVGSVPLRETGTVVALLISVVALAAAGPVVGPLSSLAPAPSDDANGAGDTEPTTTTDVEIITPGDNMPVVNLSDIFSPDELVSDHRVAIEDRSYRLRITRVRETNLSERPLVVQETVKQVGDRYVHRLRPENDAGTISAQDVYSNGSAAFAANYRSADSPYRYERLETMPPGPRDWMTQRLATYLNTTNMDVESMNGTEGGLRITGDGAPPAVNASVYHLSAVRSSTGLITELRVEYARGGRTEYVTWTYSSMADASIDPPAWYGRKFGDGTETATPTATATA